jgi:hypothetical protein
MQNFKTVKNLFFLAALGAVVTGCTIEPIKTGSREEAIKDAPDWVNTGTTIVNVKEMRLFYGVASASPKGDMALQKSIADDKSRAEVGEVLASYLKVVSNDYTSDTRWDDPEVSDDELYRVIDNAAERQVKEGVTHQIDDAIKQQFKDNISTKLKDEITGQIKASSKRNIKYAISNQIEFSRQLADDIAQQIKESVLRQTKNTVAENLKGSKIVGSWRDPQTNTIWSYSELDLNYVKKVIAEAKELDVELKTYFAGNAETIFDRIIKDADGEKPFTVKKPWYQIF